MLVPSAPAGYFHRGFHVKTGNPGDSGGGGDRDAIEQAASQVMMGVNGMVEYLGRHHAQLLPHRRKILVPVIFTTATLYTTAADMASAAVATGEMDPASLAPTPVPYLFYQYPVSPGIKHTAQPVPVQGSNYSGALSQAFASEFLRTIVVVNAGGIAEFTKRFWPDHMDLRSL